MKATVLFFLLLVSLLGCQDSKPFHISEMELPPQVDSRMLVTDNKELVYSSNVSGKYQFYKLQTGRVEMQGGENKDVFNPFMILGEVGGICDSDGDEKNNVISKSDLIKSYIGPGQSLSFIQSSPSGKFVAFRLKGDGRIYLIDLVRGEKLTIRIVRDRLHAVSFSQSDRFILVSVDSAMFQYDLQSRRVIELAPELPGEKLNPFIHQDAVYFVNNSASEFYSIYKIDLSQDPSSPVLFLAKGNDLRMPKFDGANLYFIEIKASEYLLSRYHEASRQIDELTTSGVVYSYEFIGGDSIAMTFSDFFRPRCLRIYSKSRNLFLSSLCDSIKHSLSVEILKGDQGPAYLIQPAKGRPLGGVVLFLHPGLHADFSPRWDDIIMSLSANGLAVIAPNFPMSSGFGKSYAGQSLEAAVSSIDSWAQYISDRYDLPIYVLSSSSANILMEMATMRRPDHFNAAASLFGLRSGVPIDPKFPTLYILGQNDPIVDFKLRSTELATVQSKNDNVRVISYRNEGHWLRNNDNIRDAQKQIISLFLEHR